MEVLSSQPMQVVFLLSFVLYNNHVNPMISIKKAKSVRYCRVSITVLISQTDPRFAFLDNTDKRMAALAKLQSIQLTLVVEAVSLDKAVERISSAGRMCAPVAFIQLGIIF